VFCGVGAEWREEVAFSVLINSESHSVSVVTGSAACVVAVLFGPLCAQLSLLLLSSHCLISYLLFAVKALVALTRLHQQQPVIRLQADPLLLSLSLALSDHCLSHHTPSTARQSPSVHKSTVLCTLTCDLLVCRIRRLALALFRSPGNGTTGFVQSMCVRHA
jgi:hypothetical protein